MSFVVCTTPENSTLALDAPIPPFGRIRAKLKRSQIVVTDYTCIEHTMQVVLITEINSKSKDVYFLQIIYFCVAFLIVWCIMLIMEGKEANRPRNRERCTLRRKS